MSQGAEAVSGGVSEHAVLPKLRRAARLNGVVRPITDEDMPFLARLYRSTREDELALTGWEEAQKQSFVDMQFRAQHVHYRKHYPDALWLIVEQTGKAMGRLYLERWSKEHRIIDIALLPSARGKGFGEAMLRDLHEEAALCGRAVSIHVEKLNPAMSLYRRLGYQAVEDKGVYELLMWTPAD